MNTSEQGSPSRPFNNGYWVIKGRFAAGEYPGDRDPARAARVLGSLLSQGIDHFIDLTEPRDGLEPYAQLAEDLAGGHGLSTAWTRHAIRDRDIPRSRAQMTAILDEIDAALGQGRGVYVHCWGGVGRTGTVVGCWLVRHGSSGEDALRQVNSWWQSMEKAALYWDWDSPEAPSQKEFVRSWSEAADR